MSCREGHLSGQLKRETLFLAPTFHIVWEAFSRCDKLPQATIRTRRIMRFQVLLTKSSTIVVFLSPGLTVIKLFG